MLSDKCHWNLVTFLLYVTTCPTHKTSSYHFTPTPYASQTNHQKLLTKVYKSWEQILGKLIMFHSKIVFRQTTHALNKNWSLLKENYFPIERKEIRWKNLSLLLQSTVICGKISSLLVAKITSWKNYFLLFLDKFVKIGGNWKNCRF